jgi:hypothetical protein
LLRYKEIVKVFEDLVHGKEFKKEFVQRVLEAEKRIDEEGVEFKSVEEMDKYLDKMEERFPSNLSEAKERDGRNY